MLLRILVGIAAIAIIAVAGTWFWDRYAAAAAIEEAARQRRLEILRAATARREAEEAEAKEIACRKPLYAFDLLLNHGLLTDAKADPTEVLTAAKTCGAYVPPPYFEDVAAGRRIKR